MTKSLYLLAAFCMLSTTFAQDGFLSLEEIQVGEYENGEGEFENWENEECVWEYETELNLNDDLDLGTAGKAVVVDVDSSNIAGNTAEEIGNAVRDAIIATSTSNTSDAQVNVSTGNADLDNAITGAINGAVAASNSITDNLNNNAQSVGDKVGSVVTDSINAVNQTPEDVNGALGGVMTQAATDIGNNAEQIGNSVADGVNDAVQAIVSNVPNGTNNQALQNLSDARDQISSVVSNVVAAIGENADAVGTAAGNAVGDAVTQSDNAANAAGNAVGNWNQAIKDNAESVADVVGTAVSNAYQGNANVSVDEIKAEVSQNLQESLENTTQEDIDQTRNSVSQSVADAINTVQAQGNDANKNVVGVINALAAPLIPQN